MNKVQITSPSESDLDTLVFWGNAAPELKASKDDKWYSKKGLKKWLKDPGRDILLVAKIDKKLAGMCVVLVFHEWAYCSTLYVHTPFRNFGIGRKLIDEANKRIKQQRIGYFALLVNEKNLPTISFYKKLGFKEGYRHVWMYKK